MTTTPLTINEAAQALGVSVKTVRRLIERRKLGTIRYTERGKILISQEELDRFQESCTTAAKPPKAVPASPRSRPPSSDCLPRPAWGKKY